MPENKDRALSTKVAEGEPKRITAVTPIKGQPGRYLLRVVVPGKEKPETHIIGWVGEKIVGRGFQAEIHLHSHVEGEGGLLQNLGLTKDQIVTDVTEQLIEKV